MAILNVLRFPDPRLRTVAQPVETVTEETRQLAADMRETMYHECGIGLAAVQVNIPQRVIVIDVSEEQDQPMCLINPEITEAQGHLEMEEGCLSVPEFRALVPRHAEIHCRALNEQGDVVEIDADGLLAICIQHEIDHLDGKLFVDYLSPLKRERIASKLRKMARTGQLPKRERVPAYQAPA